MKRKKKLKKLIASEIINAKLIFSLDKIGIDANHYLTDITDVIFDIAKISKKNQTEELLDNYFYLIKKGITIDLRIEDNKLEELINEVVIFLKSLRSGEYVGK